MSIMRCEECQQDIDTDFDAEHFQEGECFIAGLQRAKEELLEALEESLKFALAGVSELSFEQLMDKCKAAIEAHK